MQNIDIFGKEYRTELFEEEIEFLEKHKNHNVWIIDDYFKEEKNDTG